jgi:hypothetical protein
MAFTPVAKQLQQRLEDRRAWFRHWLFQWHGLRDGRNPIQVDLFDDRTSFMGGVEFSGSARDVFWDAITRGVRKEILDQFAWVDDQVRKYNRTTALESIDQAAGLLSSFAQGVRRDTIEKDRILRGNGINFPPTNDLGHWHGTSQQEIQSYAEALKLALPSNPGERSSIEQPLAGRSHRLNKLWHDNQWWLGPVSLIAGLVGLAALL